MAPLKRVRFFLEYMALRIGFLLVPLLGRRLVRILASAGGSAAYACCRNLRRITLANLDIAFGADLPKEDLQEIARQSFRAAALVLLDFLWFSRHTSERISRCVSVDRSVEISLAERPVIGVTAHFGNWELLPAVASEMGVQQVNVFADLKNPYATRFLRRLRDAEEVELAGKSGAVGKLLRALRGGRSVGLLLDQNTTPRDGGIYADFFGLPVPVSTAAGLLSERTGVPIIILFCRLRPDGTYCVYSPSRLDPSKRGAAEIAASILSVFESEISKHPEQWLWMYKRWKYIPTGAPPEAYPFYSKLDSKA